MQIGLMLLIGFVIKTFVHSHRCKIFCSGTR